MVSVVEQNLPESGKIRSVVYMPYEAARAQEALISAKEGDSEVIQAARVASVPKGGSLIINFNTNKSGIVETESWNFVVADTSGKVLYSRRGLPCISAAGEKGELVSYDALLIPVKVPETFLVKIISRTTNTQNVYQIQTSSPSIGSLYK
ncbi:MAG: hypothetical protein HGB20_01140 [Chlorobiaceae bacterium]|nr:hypothetical protein [Chlorobiaceae bacterium]